MTMPIPNPTAAQVQAPPTRQSVDDRAAALAARLETESPSESAAETSESPAVASPEGESAGTSAVDSGGGAEPSAEAKAAEQRKKERLERIAAAMDRERKEDLERAQNRERRAKEREATGELEKLRARLKELEPLNDVFKDEESFLGAAETRGYSAEKMINYWRKRMTDPQAVAAQQAKSLEQKFYDELAKRDAEIEKLRQERETERLQIEEQRAGIERATSFVTQAAALADTHPRTASFLRRKGPQVLIAFANEHIAPYLPESYSLPQLHDHLEQFLDEISDGASSASLTPPANGTSQPPKKNGAEKPVTTLSNAATAERGQVTEELPLSRMSLEERERRLRDKLAREDG